MRKLSEKGNIYIHIYTSGTLNFQKMKFYLVCAFDYKHFKLNSIAIGLKMDFWQIFIFSGNIEISQNINTNISKI